MTTAHEIFATADSHSENPTTALGCFATCEIIEDHEHAAECLIEINKEKEHSDEYEKSELNKVRSFVMTAPWGEPLSRAKVDETGKWIG